MFHVKRRRGKVRSISSGAQRRIAIPLPCPSASPRDPLRWAPVGAHLHKVRSISSGAQRWIAISLPCPSASPRDPLRWAPVGAPSAQSPLHFIRRCAPDIHSTPLSLRFPTRPAPLGSRGAPSAQSPLHSIRRTAPDIHCTPLSLRFPTRPASHFSLPYRGGFMVARGRLQGSPLRVYLTPLY